MSQLGYRTSVFYAELTFSEKKITESVTCRDTETETDVFHTHIFMFVFTIFLTEERKSQHDYNHNTGPNKFVTVIFK